MSERARPIVIAHRGASGYLPEHTLAAKALAVGMGADYLEQDVVASRDDQLLVFHDLTLEQTTDVRERFPERARSDGSFYCRDFDLAELRTLILGERRTADGSLRFPQRYQGTERFHIATLAEELAFIQALEQSIGRPLGIYTEVKDPAWHRAAGFDLGDAIVETLHAFGYRDDEDRAFLQCFDANELRRLRAGGCKLRFVQLLEGSEEVPQALALDEIAGYAEAIGPSLRLIYRGVSKEGPRLTTLVSVAHARGLLVHPYTFRKDQLPDGIASFDALLELFLLQLGVDGVFTDFPDLAAQFVQSRMAS